MHEIQAVIHARVTALVLAAGASRRFGSPKQLFEVDGESLIRRAACTALAVAPTIVVIPDPNSRSVAPATSVAIRQALAGLDVTIIENPDAEEGMASSIRAGVGACNGDVLITLCDQPHVTSAHLAALVQCRAPIAATSYAATAGVPAFFSSAYRPELLELRGDRGAKALFERHSGILTLIPWAGAAIDLDEQSDAPRER